MSHNVGRRCLRPHLFTSYIKRVQSIERPTRVFSSTASSSQQTNNVRETTNDYDRRVEQLVGHRAQKEEWYPRMQVGGQKRKSILQYREQYDDLQPDETRTGDVEAIAGASNEFKASNCTALTMTLQGEYSQFE